MDQFQAAPQQHGVEMPAEHKQIFAKIYSSAGDIPVDQQHNWCSGTFWPFYTDAVALDRRFEVFEGKPLVVGQRHSSGHFGHDRDCPVFIGQCLDCTPVDFWGCYF